MNLRDAPPILLLWGIVKETREYLVCTMICSAPANEKFGFTIYRHTSISHRSGNPKVKECLSGLLVKQSYNRFAAPHKNSSPIHCSIRVSFFKNTLCMSADEKCYAQICLGTWHVCVVLKCDRNSSRSFSDQAEWLSPDKNVHRSILVLHKVPFFDRTLSFCKTSIAQ